ncbi:vimentin-type intermediate filament-associated coiled-coil protein [Rhinatrema bivittatum]|uniref:vimentin-type intermediate filament-associated coiled-coil protein n=1 Tax=Rhinatrema bivittatum TaxID=194408 RepID=UPI0011296157|nr:vimentin-type intermediate filament-associated coiled-coil protein [Rhinatrema bivittatum]
MGGRAGSRLRRGRPCTDSVCTFLFPQPGVSQRAPPPPPTPFLCRALARAGRGGATPAMSVLSPLQIKEANAHLEAVHRRVAELEARLGAAETTVREQAESLIRKDEQLHVAVREITGSKDREISELKEQLSRSEDTIQKLLSVIKEKDDLLSQLKHRSQLLGKICRRRPLLDTLLSDMAEGEQLTALPGTEPHLPFPSHEEFMQETNGLVRPAYNQHEFSLSEDETDDPELEKCLFGTTV